MIYPELRFSSPIRILKTRFVYVYQITDTGNKDCPGTIQTVTAVPFCPINKEQVDKAARAKNCSQFARKQNCSSPDSFKYHCVINEYRNRLLEVCARRRFIIGN